MGTFVTFARMLLWLRTIRYVRRSQITWRIWRKLYRPKVPVLGPVDLKPLAATWMGAERAPSLLGPNSACYLNNTQDLTRADIWNAPDLPKLWLYNLHYFDDLLARDADARSDWHMALISRWMAENPAPDGNGWEPYPTSLRIVNWVKWTLSGNYLPDGGVQSLATQAAWLSRNLEHHLLGNHLFANAKALVFAGAVVDGPGAARWLTQGLEILAREIPEQTLPAGGQFELSPMYHALFVEDLLDLVQLADMTSGIPAVQVDDWRKAAAKALGWMQGLTHPDGRVAFFNDAAFGISAEPHTLEEYGKSLGVEPTDTGPDFDGYVRLQSGPAVLIADAAAIGPDYLPGHAHADSLSFELSLAGLRVIVNGGTSVYGGDMTVRQAERSTPAHNTVTVDDQNSSEVWSAFRVARRATILERDIQTAEPQQIMAAHDGFRRTGGPLHRRTWLLDAHSLTIKDSLEGRWQTATARIRLHPPHTLAGDRIDGPWPIHVACSGATLRTEDGFWAPEFGKRVPCQILCMDFTGPEASITLSWEG